MNLFILQKEWLDKCEQAKRAKLAEENSTDNAPDNDKHPKEDKAAPSRSMSLDSNTLGERFADTFLYFEQIFWYLFYSCVSFCFHLFLAYIGYLTFFPRYFTRQTSLQLFKL